MVLDQITRVQRLESEIQKLSTSPSPKIKYSRYSMIFNKLTISISVNLFPDLLDNSFAPNWQRKKLNNFANRSSTTLSRVYYDQFADLADLSGKTLSGRTSSGGTSRTTPSMESYSSSLRAKLFLNTFSNSILSNSLAFSSACARARLQ